MTVLTLADTLEAEGERVGGGRTSRSCFYCNVTIDIRCSCSGVVFITVDELLTYVFVEYVFDACA
jgi:hypothetical protein